MMHDSCVTTVYIVMPIQPCTAHTETANQRGASHVNSNQCLSVAGCVHCMLLHAWYQQLKSGALLV
jgi:hypothetical protein